MPVLRGGRIFRPASNASLRRAVYDRDHSVCAICNRNMDELAEKYREARILDVDEKAFECKACGEQTNARPCSSCGSSWQQQLDESVVHRSAVVKEAGYTGRDAEEFARRMESNTSLWEADHEVPLSEDGVDDVSNARTLCFADHHRVTVAGRKRLTRMLGRSKQSRTQHAKETAKRIRRRIR